MRVVWIGVNALASRLSFKVVHDRVPGMKKYDIILRLKVNECAPLFPFIFFFLKIMLKQNIRIRLLSLAENERAVSLALELCCCI